MNKGKAQVFVFYLINRNLRTAMKNELSLSGMTSQVIEPRLSMGLSIFPRFKVSF